MSKNQILKIILSSFIVLIVAILGSIFVNIGMSWFNNLKTPSDWVANILIPIVWTIVYSAFAIINYLWIKQDGFIPKKITILMIINAILNILWCLVFFTLHQLFLGNVFIILILIFSFILVLNILKEKELFGYILSIYPIWVSIATTLNIALWILN